MAGGGSSINSVTFTPIKTTFETSSGYENGGTITINCSGAPDSAVDITNETSSDSSIAAIFVNSLSRTVSGNNVTLEYRVWAKSPGTATLTAEAWDNVNLRSVTGTLQVTVVSPTPAEDTTYLNERGLRHLWQGIDAAKQDTLTAGANITISNGTISATVPTRTTIYSNSSGTNASFTTTSAMSNYDDVEITFRDGNSNYATRTVPGSAGSFVLDIVHPGASSVAFWYISRFIVSGTGITVGANNMRKALQASSLATTATQDIYITKMVGIKY